MLIAFVSYIQHVLVRAEPAICQHVTKFELIITTNFQYIPEIFVLGGFSLAFNFWLLVDSGELETG